MTKNSSTSRHLAHQTRTKQTHTSHKKSQRTKFVENQKFDLSQIRCYKCNNMGHYANKCPLKQQHKDIMTKEKVNSTNTREIVLNNNSSDDVHVNMVQISNVGQKTKVSHTDVPLPHDLYNWVMDSRATCHMTPYQTDFLPDSVNQIKKIVEIADGYNVPANLSGTVLIKTKNDAGENIAL